MSGATTTRLLAGPLRVDFQFFSVSIFTGFYRATVMQRTVLRRPFCPSVRLSVCPSVKRMDCNKTKETCAQILTPYERTFILVFLHEEWLVRDYPLYLKFWAKLTLFEHKCLFSIDIRSYRFSRNS